MENRDFAKVMFKCSRELRRTFLDKEISKKDGMPKSFMSILDALHDRDRMTVTKLSGILSIPQPNCSRSVNKIAEAGYIKKINSELDKRVVSLELTDDGRNLVRNFHEGIIDEISSNIDGCRYEDIEQLNHHLGEVYKILQNM